jgi:hypothetical protein
MTYQWAGWLRDSLRADPILAPKVVEVPGWETRGRPPSEFSFFPSGQLAHHTACMIRNGHDPQSCVNVIASGHSGTPGPISQGLITWTKPGTRWNGSNLDPHVVLIAAGRANHAGAGIYPWGAPSGNGSSIGWECCGPPADGWPRAMVDFYDRVLAAVARNRMWSVDQITTHWEYGTPRGRKIDPSGAYHQQPNLRQTDPWSPALQRGRVADLLTSKGPRMFPITPTRLIDTRPGQPAGLTNPFKGVLPAPTTLTLAAPPAVPASATGLFVSATSVDPLEPGFVTVWPSGSRPNASFMNPRSGVSWGSTFVGLAQNRTFQVHISGGGHLIVDVWGYA